MRLADDDRGRVPFALVGALLLVASASVATTLSKPRPDPGPPDAAVAADRALASARTAIRSAVSTALARGAADPVLAPANSPYGRVLNDSEPYRDALRARAYVRAQRAVATASSRVGDATATVSLPAVDSPADLRAGKRAVSLSGHGNATVAATVRKVSVVVRVDDRVVARRTHDVSVAVASPALVLHDRVQRFEQRLHRGAVDGPGFGRQFAARLYGVAYLRGYAQYGGAGVAQVVSNRMVALSANGAALATQRGAFGTADAAGVRAHHRAVARVGIREVADRWSTSTVTADDQVTAVLGDHPRGTLANAEPDVPAIPAGGVGPDDALSVSVNATAADAFADLLAGRDGPSLDDVLAGTYDARLRTAVRTERVEAPGEPSLRPPGDGWERVDSSVERSVSIRPGRAPLPVAGGDEARVATRERVVTVTRRHRSRWRRGGETRTTTGTTTERVRVGVAVLASHHPNASAVGRVPSAFEDRSALDPNLVDVAADAKRVFDDHGGVDAMATRAALGRFEPIERGVTGTYTNRTRAAVYRDVAALRETVADVSVSVDRGRMLVGEPPTARLLSAVRERRADLAPAPGEHRSVADAATVAARRAYLAHVERRLADRVAADERVLARLERAVDRAVGETTDSAVGGLGGVLRATERTDDAAATAVHSPLVGDVDVAVAGSPSYLVLDGVDAERVPSVARERSVHPLAARNVNVFTVPSGDAASRVVDAVAPSEDGTSLRAAVRQLDRANAIPRSERAEPVDRRHRRLRRAVGRSVAAARGRLASALAEQTELDADAATAAVADAFAAYGSTRARAKAVVDGSVVQRVVDAAAERADDPGDRFRDASRAHVESALRDARAASAVRPPSNRVDALRGVLEDRADGLATDATEGAAGRLRNESNGSFLGLPLAPVPGHWYATANVWVVDVRGTYPTFAVRARNGTTGRLATTTYVRDGSSVAVDVDDDGVADRLGYADRVTARATVPVAVVVPPGKDGVGDRDLVMTERSPGWPCPVPARRPGAIDATLANASRGGDAGETSDAGGRPGASGSTEPSGCEGDLYPRRQPMGMFHEQRQDVDGLSPADLRAEYADDLATVVGEHGVDAIAETTDLDRAAVEAIGDGDLPDSLSLQDAAAVLSVRDGVADPDTVVEMACDHLLLGMTTGVMDVDAVASDLDIDLGAKAVQQRIERRAPMTFDEYVHVQHVIASRQP